MKRTILAIITVVLAIGVMASAVLAGMGLLSGGTAGTTVITKLDLDLPEEYLITSYAVHKDTLVLCCYDGGSLGGSYSLLTYSKGDSEFRLHPIDFGFFPYEQKRTALLVVNDTLYLFYTKQTSSDPIQKFQSFLWKVSTSDWALYDERILLLPSRLAPGVEVTDGKDLYIIGGYTSSPDLEVWQKEANDTIYKVDVSTGKAAAVATIAGASNMHGAFIGDRLMLIEGGTGVSGSPEYNYDTHMKWASVKLYDAEDWTSIVSEYFPTQDMYGSLPATDGTSAYFVNPYRYNDHTTQWGFDRHVWKMSEDGSVVQSSLPLPSSFRIVAGICLADGIFFISEQNQRTTFWWCGMAELFLEPT